MKRKSAVLACLIFAMSGCTAMGMGTKTPDFYPNESFYRKGAGQAEADARTCMAMADEYVKQPNKYGSIAKQGLIGGTVGAGTGAIGGVIMKDSVGRATAAGAAIGGLIGVAKGVSEMNDKGPYYERFVERCLQEKGYEVVGWSAK